MSLKSFKLRDCLFVFCFWDLRSVLILIPSIYIYFNVLYYNLLYIIYSYSILYVNILLHSRCTSVLVIKTLYQGNFCKDFKQISSILEKSSKSKNNVLAENEP